MKLELYSVHKDEVIDSTFLTGLTNYESALVFLHPLIDRLDIQRKIQNEKFYKRLETDILEGCIMPPITIAFVGKEDFSKHSLGDLQKLLTSEIKNGFILDGIQRLNTLKRVETKNELDKSRPLFLNILICKSKDNLLYRMVTLNNGQKPMSARHQIEILAANIYEFEKMKLKIVSEKEAQNRRYKDALRKSDVISAYLAFLSDTISLDSTKIIQSKLDELIAKRIIDSEITKDNIEFSDVLEQIERLTNKHVDNLKWFKNANNLVGFSVGVKKSIADIKTLSQEDFSELAKNFENAFKNINISKIKVSTERKKLSSYVIENIKNYKDADEDDLLMAFSEIL